jgi:hypothetical protein
VVLKANKKIKQGKYRLELLTPGLKVVEAMMVLKHRFNYDFKDQINYRA